MRRAVICSALFLFSFITLTQRFSFSPLTSVSLRFYVFSPLTSSPMLFSPRPEGRIKFRRFKKMKKVVYSVSKINRFGNNRMTGVGFITDDDLVIACVSRKGNAYIRVFEDCVKTAMPCPIATVSSKARTTRYAKRSSRKELRAVKTQDTRRERSKSNTPSGTNSWTEKEAYDEQILPERISVLRRRYYRRIQHRRAV